MMTGITIAKETRLFLLSLAVGAGMSFLYDLLRVLRRRRPGLTHAADAVFGLVCLLGALWALTRVGGGEPQLYLLLGATGLPVFSGFAGGLGKLAGPTGGYLLGFIFMTLAAGFMVERFPDRIFLHGIGMAVGTAICYLFGTVWLAEQMSLTFTAALGVGVIPYLPGDAVKILLAVILGPKLRKAVRPMLSR